MATSTSHFVKTAARVFVSAPIVKRLDLFTLKTTDGIFVLLKGLINKERTCNNGFSEEQGIGSEDTVDADINPAKAKPWKDSNMMPEHFIDEAQEATTELQDDQNIDSVEERMDLDSNNMPEHFTVGAQETTTYFLDDQNVDTVEVRKDLGSSNMPRHFTDEAQEATIKLRDDQNIESVEERSFRDASSIAQDHNKDRHSNVGFREEEVRYSLRNRKVPYFEAKGACKGKDVNEVAKTQPFSEKTTIGAEGISTMPSVTSLENPQAPGTTPLCGESSKEKADHPKFAASGGVNDANNAEDIAANKYMSVAGETLAVENSMRRMEKAQESHKHDDMQPILQDASKAKNSISHHSSVGKSCKSKKRKRVERRIAQKNTVSTRSLLKKTGENTKAFAASGGVNDANNAEDIAANRYMSVAGETLAVENSVHRMEKAQESRKHDDMPPILEDASKAKNSISPHSSVGKSCKSKKRKRVERRIVQKNTVSTRSSLKKTGENTKAFSPQDADKLVNSTSHDICMEKSDGSKKERKRRSILTSTTVDIKNCHDSARPTPRTCTSKAKSNSKAATPGLEGKASTVSTPKFGTRRKLVYAEKTTCTTDGENKEAPTSRKENKTPTSQRENKTPTSRSLVIRTSRSGRLLLPTMEFWRNQLPMITEYLELRRVQLY